jgi:hypothetical protein
MHTPFLEDESTFFILTANVAYFRNEPFQIKHIRYFPPLRNNFPRVGRTSDLRTHVVVAIVRERQSRGFRVHLPRNVVLQQQQQQQQQQR